MPKHEIQVKINFINKLYLLSLAFYECSTQKGAKKSKKGASLYRDCTSIMAAD